MKRALAALAVALAACGGAEPAAIEDGIASGTVLGVAGFHEREVVVLLDRGGAALALTSGGARYRPGERVRVLFGDDGASLLGGAGDG